MASLSHLVLYLCLHACTARPLMIWDKETFTQLQLSRKDVKTSIADRLPTYGERTLDHGTKIMQLDNHKSREAGNVEGKKVKTSYSWKIFLPATGTKVAKRADRSTLESPPFNAEKNMRSKVADIVVMDYAQPHRKPPIHNRGT